jgi:hypothetical protein
MSLNQRQRQILDQLTSVLIGSTDSWFIFICPRGMLYLGVRPEEAWSC